MSEAEPLTSNAWKPHDPWVMEALREAEFGELRLVYQSSNYVFVARMHHPVHGEGLAVYKPARGEQPLHDFPDNLWQREIAAYEFSRILGWPIIPPTVERVGPHGAGSLQLFIEHDPRQHYFELREQDEHDWPLIRFAVFDLAANNADRKGGHLLLDPDGAIWGIDNGLCFNRYWKVRTVIWDFGGTELPEEWVQDLVRARGCIALGEPDVEILTGLLSITERAALLDRLDGLIARPVLPEMDEFPQRVVPWPMI
jgi:uncharacterized repeat protein (TIGR03843 family)